MKHLLIALVLLVAPAISRAGVTLGVDSSAAHFSPGNWSGDAGRAGAKFRRTWCSGAWCEFRWTTPADHPSAQLLITNATAGSRASFFVDGRLTENLSVSATGGLAVPDLASAGPHTLIVYTASSDQKDRWSEANGFTIAGLVVDDGAAALPAPPERPWVMIIGDSITEGIGAGSSLGDYAFLVGQGLAARGYDTCVSACGYSGWIHPGDATNDVPAYYAIKGGAYSDKDSRWNKIDAHASLLDSDGHLSAYGEKKQEPAAIVFNYIVNETLSGMPAADAQASVTGSLGVLRKAAPRATIIVFIPPGLQDVKVYSRGPAYIAALRDGVADYIKSAPSDKNVFLIDLGSEIAHALASPPYGGGVHPNPAGHAYQAPIILQAILAKLPERR